MTRAERKLAAQAALQRLWSAGRKWRRVADALGVEPRVVSQWNAGRLAPNHGQLDRLVELGQPREVRALVRDVTKAPSIGRVERVLEMLGADVPLSGRQLNAIERALCSTMP